MSSEISFNREELGAFSGKLTAFEKSLTENERDVLQLILARASAGSDDVLQEREVAFRNPASDKTTLVKLAKAIEGKTIQPGQHDLDWVYNIWTYHF